MKTIKLPSKFQHGDKVLFGIKPAEDGEWICPMVGKVTGIHLYPGKVKYDLELGEETRIYNVDSYYVQKFSDEAYKCYSINAELS